MTKLMHVSTRRLYDFAHGELSGVERKRITPHLAACAKCRLEVKKLRDFRRGLRDLPLPGGDAGTLAAILARRAAGDRVILPVVSPGRRLPDRPLIALGGVAAAVIAAAVLLTPASDVAASDSSGNMTFSPALPRAGAAVDLEYRPPASLAAESILIVRARFRTPADEAYNARAVHVVAARLRRTASGSFRGGFRLPSDVVFASFAVEDEDGSRVDSNDNRLWDVLTTSASARADEPSYESLEQRRNDYMGRNWEEAHKTAKRITELYPGRPEGWHMLFWYDKQVLGESVRDSLLALYRPRLRALHARFEAMPHVSADDAGTLAWFAAGIGDSAIERHWWDRLLREAPRNPLAVQERVRAAIDRMRRKDSLYFQRAPENVVAAMDSILADAGPAHEFLFLVGVQAANRTRDPAAIRRWSELYLIGWPSDSASVAAKYARYPELRREGLTRLREMARSTETPDDSRRPLEMSRPVFNATIHARKRSEVLRYTGEALHSMGDLRAAADTLSLAADLVWHPELFQRAAAAAMAVGDTSRAIEFHARAYVDPGVTDSVRRHIETIASRWLADSAWASMQSAARAQMRGMMLAGAKMRVLPARIRIASEGRETTLATVLAGKTAIVTVWSARCGPAIDDLPELVKFRQAMQRRGIPVITVAESKLDERAKKILSTAGVDYPVYEDSRGDLIKAFANFSTPAYYVVDRLGRIRFERTLRVDIPRQLEAIGEG